MLKKGILTLLIVALGIVAFGLAHADQIDGLVSGGSGTTTTGPALPATLDIYVNPGALGDALIYGYYNARGSFNFIRVINTSESAGIAAKVRFREGKNSNEVLDFAICLSAGDQWSAWVLDDGNENNPALLYWYDDDTPSNPDPNSNNVVSDNYLAVVPFHYSATGAASSVTADDTKEGYFEIIGARAWADTPGWSGSEPVDTPSECAQAAGITSGFTPTVYDVPNTLAGNSYIFNIADAAGTYAYNATALAYFRQAPISISLASDSSPRLDDAEDGLEGVNFVLTKAVEYAIYDIETWLIGATDIINTFPTKRLSIEEWTYNGPFNDYASINSAGEIEDDDDRCEIVSVTIWDDEENTPETTTGFSPGETPDLQKCDEVNVIVVGATASSLLDSNLVQFNLNNSGFELGWISEDFTTVSGRSTTIGSVTTYGLPVISYELQGVVDGYFSHMLPLRYVTDIVYELY